MCVTVFEWALHLVAACHNRRLKHADPVGAGDFEEASHAHFAAVCRNMRLKKHVLLLSVFFLSLNEMSCLLGVELFVRVVLFECNMYVGPDQ